MSLRAYLRILRKRWRAVVVSTLLVLVAAVAWTVTTPRTYTAHATSFVSITSSGSKQDDSSLYQSSQFAMQRVKSYTEIVQSPDVLQPVIDNLKLTMGLRDLRPRVSAENPVDTVLLTVSVSDSSAARAQAIANAVSDQLGRVVERLETPRQGGTPPVMVTTAVPAQLPSTPTSPRPALNLALGLLFGAALGIVLAVLRDQQDTTVRGEELQELTGRSPLALVGINPNARTRPLVTLEGHHGRRVEEYRSLRTNLQFVDVDEPPRRIVVTSALADEGKTTVACNLAIALAQSSLRVCLIEADLRRPKVATYLGIEASIGLSNVLAGQLDLSDALTPWPRGLLTVLAAGTPPPDPSRLLGSRNMEKVLAELAGRFDFVVIDAPPILPVTDAAVLARATDGALLVTRYGRTRREQVVRAMDDLEAVQARMIGSVLTFVPPKAELELRGHDYAYTASLSDRDTSWEVDNGPSAGSLVSTAGREPAASGDGSTWHRPKHSSQEAPRLS